MPYPALPGLRIPYHRDGSVGFWFKGTSAFSNALDATHLTYMNDEDNNNVIFSDGFSFPTYYIGVVFPALKDVVGFYTNMVLDNGAPGLNVQTSADTTNGFDGTWTTRLSGYDPTAHATYRDITAMVVGGVNAVRIQQSISFGGTYSPAGYMHIYGTPTVTPTSGLAIWHPTLDQEVDGDFFNWGDVSRSTTANTTFRVKNRDAARTAHGLSVGMEALTPGSPSIVSSHTFSTDGSNFFSTISPADLAPSAISSLLYLKRTNPALDQLGLRASYMVATAASWT